MGKHFSTSIPKSKQEYQQETADSDYQEISEEELEELEQYQTPLIGPTSLFRHSVREAQRDNGISIGQVVSLQPAFLQRIAEARDNSIRNRSYRSYAHTLESKTDVYSWEKSTLPFEWLGSDYTAYTESNATKADTDMENEYIHVHDQPAGNALALIGLGLTKGKKKFADGFSDKNSHSYKALIEALWQTLYHDANGRKIYLFDAQQSSSSQNPSAFERKAIDSATKAQISQEGLNNLSMALSVARKMYADLDQWTDNIAWEYKKNMGVLGQFAENDDGGIIRYRSLTDSTAVSTLVHELGHKREFELSAEDMVKLYRGLLARTKDAQLKPSPSDSAFHELSLFLPQLEAALSEKSSSVSTKLSYPGVIINGLDISKTQATEFLSTTAEELVGQGTVVESAEEMQDIILEDPLRVALFLKFANPALYTTASQLFERQMKQTSTSEPLKSLDEILHVD